MTSADFFEKYRYFHVKKMLPIDVCNIATQYALYHRMQNPQMRVDPQIPNTHSVYGDPLMETLLQFSKPHMEKVTGLDLIPTYSYFRIYKPGDILARHKDRPSCEISTTITLGYHYTGGTAPGWVWPMSVGDSNGEIGTKGNSLHCEQGDCIIYRGCELEHWREPLVANNGSYHVQVFLHYINANGPFANEHAYDGRKGLGYALGSGDDRNN